MDGIGAVVITAEDWSLATTGVSPLEILTRLQAAAEYELILCCRGWEQQVDEETRQPVARRMGGWYEPEQVTHRLFKASNVVLIADSTRSSCSVRVENLLQNPRPPTTKMQQLQLGAVAVITIYSTMLGCLRLRELLADWVAAHGNELHQAWPRASASPSAGPNITVMCIAVPAADGVMTSMMLYSLDTVRLEQAAFILCVLEGCEWFSDISVRFLKTYETTSDSVLWALLEAGRSG